MTNGITQLHTGAHKDITLLLYTDVSADSCDEECDKRHSLFGEALDMEHKLRGSKKLNIQEERLHGDAVTSAGVMLTRSPKLF